MLVTNRQAFITHSHGDKPAGLDQFRGLHAGETILVCGCGRSLAGLTAPERFITIGVNDVGRLFDPTYLVVLNPREQFAGDRFRYVEQSRARAIFTQLDLGLPHPSVVRFRLGAHGGTEPGDGASLPYTSNSPYVALCLAAFMGARRIGLIGVDFTDDHFFARTGQHPLSHDLARIDREYAALAAALGKRGVELVNLSAESRLTALPKQPLERIAAAEAPPVAHPSLALVPAPAPARVFFVNYRFLSAGDVFTDGLARAAAEVGAEHDACYWDDPALPAKVARFAPDLLFVVHGRRFAQRFPGGWPATPSAVWLLDEPYEVDDTASWSHRFGTVFVNDPATLARHRNAHYLRVAFDPIRHFPPQPGAERRYACGFVGGYSAAREAALLRLAEAGLLSYVVGGPWHDPRLRRLCLAENASPDAAADLYRQTKIVVNIFREQHHFNRARIAPHALNLRIFEALACGAAAVSDPRPEAAALPGLPLFAEAGALAPLVRALLADDARRTALVERCTAEIASFTYAQRLREALRIALPQRPDREPRAIMPTMLRAMAAPTAPLAPPPSGWILHGEAWAGAKDGVITLAMPHAAGPRGEWGLASETPYREVSLAFELDLDADAWFIAKIHQQSQTDPASNSYHFVRRGAHAYLAMHDRVLQALLPRPSGGFAAIELSWRQGVLRASVDGSLWAEVANADLPSGFCFVGVKQGTARLRNLRIDGADVAPAPAMAALPTGWAQAHDPGAGAGTILLGPSSARGSIVSIDAQNDVELEFELLLDPGASFIAAIHQQDREDPSSNSYHFITRPGAAYLAKHHVVLASIPPLQAGWHRLQLRRAGQRLALSVDGRPLANVADTQLQSGFCRLGVEGGTARVRDLRVLALHTGSAAGSAHPVPETVARALPFTAMPRRNLLYHVWPARGSLWRWNVEQLCKRIDLFNGRRIIGIVQDTRSEPAETVMAAFEGHGCEFIVRANAPHGEAVTFPDMLERIASRDPNEITFYGHAKGVKYGADVTRPVKRWTETLYRVNLDDWRSVWAQLQRGACTGAFRMLGRFPAHRNLGDWHYSGTFFWLRHARVFEHGVPPIQPFYGGVEAWPGMHFQQDDTGCLFLDGLRQLPYHESFWRDLADPALRRWDAALRPFHPPPDLAEPLPFSGFAWPRLEQRPDEMAWMVETLLQAAPRRVLTIGARHGGFEWHLARIFRQHGRDLDITTIELDPGPDLAHAFGDAESRFGQRLQVIKADSGSDAAREAIAGRAFDAAFIDGDHGYRGARRDWLLAKSTGARLIGFHDVADTHWHAAAGCCVSRLWSEIKTQHRTEERAAGDWGGIGIAHL